MTKQELQQLRNEITLNSLYTSDYNNSFNIDPRQVQDFFNGYLEDCETIPNDNGDVLCDMDLSYDDYYDTLFTIANNIDNLYDYYISFEEDPLSQKYFEKYYQNRLTN